MFDAESYLLGKKSGGGGSTPKAFDYIINAGNNIILSDNNSFEVEDENLISQLQQILIDGVYDSNRNLKPLRIGLRAKTDILEYDYAFLTVTMISDETEDTFDELPFGNYLAYKLDFHFTIGNMMKHVILLATTETGVENAVWNCTVTGVQGS